MNHQENGIDERETCKKKEPKKKVRKRKEENV